MEDWDFNENKYWTSPNPESLMFDGYIYGERCVFAISQVALNDFYGTADTADDAITNYLENSDHVEAIATRFASEFDPNEQAPHYFIDSNEFRRLA
ncbi:hypothetical protein L1D40_12710 [Shewanella insulae]|uniref:hypothetical protein n=1 Tax=Shewanella insulae TaxID=2681496 RepID=UPI001EFC5B5D|nr:hypothetical protein [Shewanella insulae]MCG9756075.1 hypothetical protein [Shewanella insulae]